jgi:hypothetical protein
MMMKDCEIDVTAWQAGYSEALLGNPPVPVTDDNLSWIAGYIAGWAAAHPEPSDDMDDLR